MATGNPWTADEDGRLRGGWPTESISVIAKALGRTRNSIVGRAARIGLPHKPLPMVKLARPAPLPRKPVEASPTPSAPPAHKRLLNLALWDCHWPIGDPRDRDFAFCGARALRPYGYCIHHERMNYGK